MISPFRDIGLKPIKPKSSFFCFPIVGLDRYHLNVHQIKKGHPVHSRAGTAFSAYVAHMSIAGRGPVIVENGVSVIIGNGLEWRSILDMVEGKPIGTLFTAK
jgi:hypothetical protein